MLVIFLHHNTLQIKSQQLWFLNATSESNRPHKKEPVNDDVAFARIASETIKKRWRFPLSRARVDVLTKHPKRTPPVRELTTPSSSPRHSLQNNRCVAGSRTQQFYGMASIADQPPKDRQRDDCTRRATVPALPPELRHEPRRLAIPAPLLRRSWLQNQPLLF